MKNYPVIKVAILFIAGILSAQIFQLNLLLVALLFLATLSLMLFYRKLGSNTYYSLLTFLASGFLVFSIGNFLADQNKISIDPFLTQIDKVKNTTAVGEITKIDLIRNNELIFYLSVDSMYSEEFLIKDEINLLCKAKLDNKATLELYSELKPGNYVEVNGYYYKGKQKRNPGEYDYDAYLKSKEILGLLSITDITSITIISNDVSTFKNIIHQIRKAIDGQIKKYHSPETAALLRGLLLADRGEINYQTKTKFINAGVVHVLAVSGLHVGYIILIFLFLFGRFNLHLKSILTIIGLLCFMFITGVPPSVFRATVMTIVLIIAFLSNRSTNLINSISIAALIILVINPNEIYNPGFQLSFAAVLAIGIILPYINHLIEGWNVQNKFLRYILVFFGVSLSAQIGTLPFTLLYFNKFSVIALLTNLFVIPGIGFIIGAAVVTLVISAIVPFIAFYFGAANDILSGFILSVIKFSGDLSFSHINITNYSLPDLILFYLMLTVLLFYLVRFVNIKAKLALFILISANAIVFSSIDDKKLLPDGYLSVLMIDVGQGDSFLIKFPDGKTALVDAGNTTFTYDNGDRVIIPLLNYLGIKKVDYGIVTHIDTDHYGGFVALILEGMIGEIFKPEIDTSLSKDKRFEEFLSERGIPVNNFKEEKMEVANAALYFLYDDEIKLIAGESTNNRSGIFKLVYGQTSFLFTGDVEKNVENIYAKKYRYFLDSDVLKVGHHGSKTSSSHQFLKYVSPELSLISAGFKNKFGHPVEEVIQRLEAEGSTIYRSDLQKAILLRSDGQEIKLINW
ncbi:MAG TPA: DNA internalization-related competence protein ComEC/Rec2 [Ignavibacteriaceae bacterium]|nr:DNA internalization-related competence protein ComEC/Rec2 [Ignavibacteriaceae bacterium]